MATKKIESSFKNMILALLIVSAIAALSLGSVYNATKGPIEMSKQKKVNDAISVVLPEFDRTEKLSIMPAGGKDSLYLFKAFKGEEFIGTAVKTYTEIGYSGRIYLMVGILADGTINNTSVLEHKETPGLGDKMDVKKSKFPLQFMAKHPDSFKIKVKKDGGDVDAITAATITSRAFCDAVLRATDNVKINGGNK